METLESYVCGRWHAADRGFSTLVDPSTEEEIARASSEGVDFGAALEHARERGGPALRELSFAGRGELLKAMSKALRACRDELLALSRTNNGATTPDGSFDVDGGGGTLAYYAALCRGLGERTVLAEGEGAQLARTEGFWAQHVLVPRRGVAVCINAFNFPVWGFAEKAACSLAAGVPVIVKPATATALVAARAVRAVIEAGVLPEGALQLIVGGTGDLLDRLGPQDVLAFTGSADTAATLRKRTQLGTAASRFNVEADSLNAAVLGSDVATGGDDPTFELFLRDVVREMTQKTGQKCTAVRRVVVPAERLGAVRDALAGQLGGVVTGNPEDPEVTMGPLATAAQLADAEEGVAALGARVVLGGGRCDGRGAEPGRGYFFPPTLLEAADGGAGGAVHEREVFGPVATLLPYDGSAEGAAAVVALGGGTLVTSVYGDDPGWLGTFLAAAGPTTGRLYIGSRAAAGEAPGSGAALPQALHGGPGRAGGGEELGGLRGVTLYLQRLALQGSRPLVEELAGAGREEPAAV